MKYLAPISLVISFIALAVALPRSNNLGIDYLGIIVAIISLATAFAVGFQIWNALSLDNRLKELEIRVNNFALENINSLEERLKTEFNKKADTQSIMNAFSASIISASLSINNNNYSRAFMAYIRALECETFISNNSDINLGSSVVPMLKTFIDSMPICITDQEKQKYIIKTIINSGKEELIEKSRFYRPISGGTWERVTDEHGSPILNSMDLPVYQQITTSEGGLPEICRSGAESESPVPSENAGAHGTVPEGGGTPSESRFRGAQTLRSYEQGVEIRTEITARPACLQPAAFHRPASFRRCGNQDRRKGRRAGMGEMRPRPHAGTQRNRRKAALSRGSPAAVESDRHLRENPHALSAGIRKQGHVAEFRRRAVLLPRNREKSLFSDRAGSGEPRLHDETAAETLPHGARLPMEMPGIPFGFRIQ